MRIMILFDYTDWLDLVTFVGHQTKARYNPSFTKRVWIKNVGNYEFEMEGKPLFEMLMKRYKNIEIKELSNMFKQWFNLRS